MRWNCGLDSLSQLMHFVNTYCETGPQLKSARKVVSFSPESRSPRLCTCESLDRLLFLLCDFKSSFSKFRYCISLADRKNNFVVKVYKSRYERAIINFRLKKPFQLCIQNMIVQRLKGESLQQTRLHGRCHIW